MTLVALGLTACAWPMAGNGPDRRAWSSDRTITPANVRTLVTAWGPVNSGGEVVGTADVVLTPGPSGLVARDPVTGAQRWVAPGTIGTTSAIDGNRVTLGTEGAQCALEQHDLANGSLIRSRVVGTRFSDAPVSTSCELGPGILLDDDHLVTTTRSVVLREGCPGATPPQLWGLTTTVTVMERDLTARWETSDVDLGCGYPPASQRGSTPDVARVGDHYIVTRENEVLALPVDCGVPCVPDWTRTFTGAAASPMGLGNGTAYVDADGARVVDPATGTDRWRPELGGGWFSSAATDEYLILAGPTVQAYPIGGCGARTCPPEWSVVINSVIPPTSPLSVAGDLAFIGRWEEPGLVLDARGCGAPMCQPIGTIASPFFSRVSVIAGRLYVPMQGGVVVSRLP